MEQLLTCKASTWNRYRIAMVHECYAENLPTYRPSQLWDKPAQATYPCLEFDHPPQDTQFVLLFVGEEDEDNYWDDEHDQDDQYRVFVETSGYNYARYIGSLPW
jgi:hypothetical protein